MIICPVCEHQQPPAAECAQCGRSLAARPAPQPLPQRMPELEVTRYAVGPAPSAALPDLQTTRIASAAGALTAPLPELEANHPRVGNVPVEPLAEMDTGRFVDPSERTPQPTGALTCRYCRNVQSSGMLCDRCGMRLPRYSPRSAEASEGDPDDAPRVPHACGAITRSGMPCSSCGVFVPLPSE